MCREKKKKLFPRLSIVFSHFAAHWILSDDYLTRNYPFCSVRYLLLSAWLWFCLLCQCPSGSLSLWHDCTLMSIRAMAKPHSKRFMEMQWKMLTHLVIHANSGPSVGMFVWPNKDALWKGRVDRTVYSDRTGRRKQCSDPDVVWAS